MWTFSVRPLFSDGKILWLYSKCWSRGFKDHSSCFQFTTTVHHSLSLKFAFTKINSPKLTVSTTMYLSRHMWLKKTKFILNNLPWFKCRKTQHVNQPKQFSMETLFIAINPECLKKNCMNFFLSTFLEISMVKDFSRFFMELIGVIFI